MVDNTWRCEYHSGHYRRAAELLQQTTGCDDDVERLLALGTMYLYGMHLFESEAVYRRFLESTPADEQRAFWEATEEARIQGVQLLELASRKGSWPASHNLATYYSCNIKGLNEKERVARAKYFYALVDQQRTSEGFAEGHGVDVGRLTRDSGK